jgi:8-oxo-dGTP pyrophosphatase MutT (NUDIX family)
MIELLQTKVAGKKDLPLMSGAEHVQVAALCTRKQGGKTQVLMIRSLDTGRWILPKGWPMVGKTLAGSALQEAWEEAGVRGNVREEPVGYFSYAKIIGSGEEKPCRVCVFHVDVETLAKRFPEMDERKRKWMSPVKAAAVVAEPELRSLLAGLQPKPGKRPDQDNA